MIDYEIVKIKIVNEKDIKFIGSRINNSYHTTATFKLNTYGITWGLKDEYWPKQISIEEEPKSRLHQRGTVYTHEQVKELEKLVREFDNMDLGDLD